MDRTEASDAFNAGSIPVGCILFFMKGVFMDKTNWKEKTGGVKQKIQAQVSRLIQMCRENKKIMIVIAGFLIIIAGVFSVMSFSEKKKEAIAIAEKEAVAEEEGIVVPEEALEKDAYPEVNNLVKQYYQALVDGDMDTIAAIKNYVDEDEKLKIVKKSDFIEAYPVITVYTKKGPEEGSYVAYVQYEVKFVNQETTAPGLSTLYICTDENGNLYINANELEEDVVEYLKTISVQNDVVDLFNTVQVAYNDTKTQNEELSTFLDELPNLLAEAVNEAMEKKAEAEYESQLAAISLEPQMELVVTKVKVMTAVNVRKSDSVEADKIGNASEGQVLELIEERVNGWSKVNFEGKEGFIKTEFLSPQETEMRTKETPANGSGEVDAQGNAGETNQTSQKAIAKENVRVRKTASEDGEVLGSIAGGKEVEVLQQRDDGWTEVSYKGWNAYVKSEFIEFK